MPFTTSPAGSLPAAVLAWLILAPMVGLAAEPVEESIKVTVVGKVQTGIFAIGGETTGTTITAKAVTWELELGRSQKLRKTAEKLSGKLVRVHGTLERHRGVELRERWIVTVESLEEARKEAKPKPAGEGGRPSTSAVEGAVVIPGKVPAFEGHQLDARLYEYDPRLADVSATLVDQFELPKFSHAGGSATRTKFSLGAEFEPRADRKYYVTLFVLADGRRTHIGEIDGKSGLGKVLDGEMRSRIELIARPVR